MPKERRFVQRPGELPAPRGANIKRDILEAAKPMARRFTIENVRPGTTLHAAGRFTRFSDGAYSLSQAQVDDLRVRGYKVFEAVRADEPEAASPKAGVIEAREHVAEQRASAEEHAKTASTAPSKASQKK